MDNGEVTMKQALLSRTRQFALRIINLVDALPKSTAAKTIGSQIMRSGTSEGANYRSACRSRSLPEFISKIGIAIEEADETAYWLEPLIDSGIFAQAKLQPLIAEANELTAILVASSKTASKTLKTRRDNAKS